MADRIIMDVKQMPPFFRDLEEVCSSFCKNQSDIDKAFNLIQETWKDKNAGLTCRQLIETAHGIYLIYNNIGEVIDYIAEVCKNRAEYIDFGSIVAPRIEQFRIHLVEMKNMDNTMINTNPDALEEFKIALDKYIQSIVDNVDRLNTLYIKIGDSWCDSQYERFGNSIGEFSRKMQNQVDVLDKISRWLEGRIDIIRRNTI